MAYGTENTNTLLRTIGETGVPYTRISSVREANELCARLIEADQPRSRSRARIEGAVNGNTPWRHDDLVRDGQAQRCNVNFRLAEAFLEQAEGAFYDLFSESPTYSTINWEGSDNAAENQRNSAIISEEFDTYNKKDRKLDRLFQLSIREMILFGAGPVMWQDTMSPVSVPVKYKALKLSSDAKADVDDWDVAVLLSQYTPDQLYAFIRNQKAAKAMGWNIEQTRKAIMAAAPASERRQASWNWEEMQQRLNQNDLYYQVAGDAIVVCHILYREFPKEGETEGKISHKITLENQQNTEFLFDRVGRFENWRQVICPFYQDRGDGNHYGVKGLGVKMYGALEIFNRLHCATMDAAFDSLTTLFQTQTEADSESMAVVQMGARTWIKPGVNVIENNIAQRLDGPLKVKADLQEQLIANLASYRQHMRSKEGNPITAREADLLASNQASLGKTQINRYYVQLDQFWTERFRRAANSKLPESVCGAADALEFQRRCRERGVPKNFLDKVVSIRATRAMGQGSAFLRLQTLDKVLGTLQLLPASGQLRMLKTWLTANAGQVNADQWLPEPEISDRPTVQHYEATQDLASLKLGIMPVILDTQDHVIFAQTALQAGAQSLASLQQGANPAEVLKFIEMVGIYVVAHLAQIQNNPAKQRAVKALMEQWKQLAQLADQLKKQVQQMMSDHQQQQQDNMDVLQQIQNIQGGTDPETQLKMMKTMADIRLKELKTNASIADKQRKTDQQLALSDARTANQIVNSRRMGNNT